MARLARIVVPEVHLLAVIRCVSVNPMRAGLAARAEDWPWSSVGAHLKGRDDGLVQVRPVLERLAPIPFATFLDQDEPPGASRRLRAAETTGRAVGTAAFVADLERRLGRPVGRRAPGRKPRQAAEAQGSLL